MTLEIDSATLAFEQPPDSTSQLHSAYQTYLSSDRVIANRQTIRHALVHSGTPAERAAHNYDLLEDLPGSTGASAATPELTVTVPLAVLHEPLATVTKTLDLAAAERSRMRGDLEVIVWANAHFMDGCAEPKEALTAPSAYRQLRDTLADQRTAGVRVRTALQVGPKSQMSMSKLRSNYMEALAVDGIRRGFGYEHAVLWLDADTSFIRPGSFQLLADTVRGMQAHFVHAETRYSLDWASGTPLSQLDDASKAVAVAEVLRRTLVRHGIREDYDEEHGLAFALGTYLHSSGVDVRAKGGESSGLIGAAEIDGLKESIPARTALGYRTHGVRPLEYVQAAHIGMSARRHHALAQQGGARSLRNPDGSGYAGNYATTPRRTALKPVSIPKKALYELLDYRLSSDYISYEAIGRLNSAGRREAVRRTVSACIERYFAD